MPRSPVPFRLSLIWSVLGGRPAYLLHFLCFQIHGPQGVFFLPLACFCSVLQPSISFSIRPDPIRFKCTFQLVSHVLLMQHSKHNSTSVCCSASPGCFFDFESIFLITTFYGCGARCCNSPGKTPNLWSWLLCGLHVPPLVP